MIRTVRRLSVCFLVLAIASGCNRNDQGDGAAPQPADEPSATALAPYPADLSAQSSPTDVATVLIRALDADDAETLRGLVAVKHEVEAVDAIYRRHGRAGDTTPEKAATMAAAGWQATYLFFETNATQVERETIEKDTAEVFAAGKSPTGKPRTLKIKLVREDDVWKVRAGLETLPD